MDAPDAHLVLDCVRARGLLAPTVLQRLEERARATGQSVLDQALALGLLDWSRLLPALGEEWGCPWLEQVPATVAPEVRERVPAAVAHAFGVMPWREESGTLCVLVGDLSALHRADDLAFAVRCPVRMVLAEPAQVAALLAQTYATGPVEGVANEPNPETGQPGSAAELSLLASQAPIVRLVTTVLEQAVRERASDVHFEPFEDCLRVRMRVDGVLREVASPSPDLALPVVSRLKVLANLDIAERRVPQDGRIELAQGDRVVDLRVSTLPTQFGESVVLRVLDRRAVELDFAALGLPQAVRAGLEAAVSRPNGMIIVTGPTGSGKTTTLYSALQRIHRPERKLLTVEDPVEYEIEGVMQVPVNLAAGVDFARVLRSFLRHDPDVIMVGEIRDLETARIAAQAALTGHLVLTTLHTNDAPGAVARLLELGVEPYLVAGTLEAVLAQRLVRRTCPACAEPRAADPEMLRQLGEDPATWSDPVPEGRGCSECGNSGYHGRIGLYEWLPVSDSLREAIVLRASAARLQELARNEGMRSLRDGALRAVRDGVTSLAEVVRIC